MTCCVYVILLGTEDITISAIGFREFGVVRFSNMYVMILGQVIFTNVDDKEQCTF